MFEFPCSRSRKVHEELHDADVSEDLLADPSSCRQVMNRPFYFIFLGICMHLWESPFVMENLRS